MIGPDAFVGLKQVQGALSKVKDGARLKADVIGPTRHGLAVRIGSETLMLNAKAELPKADKVTLQITTMRNGGEQGVQVLATDDQPLDAPIDGSLRARSTAPNPVSSTSVENYQIEVQARPIISDAKGLAPPITVRLVVEASAGPAASNPLSTEVGRNNLQNVSIDDGSLQFSRSMPVASSLISNQLSHPADLQKVERPPTSLSQAGPGSASMSPQQGSSPSTASMPAPSNEASAEMLSRTASQTVNATVVGHSLDGKQTLLQTQDNALAKIESPIELPIGTMLQMTFLGMPMNAVETARSSSPLTRLIELLSDIERSGQNASGPSGQEKGQSVPMPDRHLTARLLQLMGLQMNYHPNEPSLSQQNQLHNNSSWTHQLQGLLADIGNAASEHLTDGWRSMTLPLGVDPAQAIMINYRENSLDYDSESSDDDTNETPAKRAIFDVDFSHLGRCQVDTLCQEQRFDLLIRSERQLDHPVEREITSLFLSACEIAGLTGEVGFQHGHFVEPATMQMSTKMVIS